MDFVGFIKQRKRRSFCRIKTGSGIVLLCLWLYRLERRQTKTILPKKEKKNSKEYITWKKTREMMLNSWILYSCTLLVYQRPKYTLKHMFSKEWKDNQLSGRKRGRKMLLFLLFLNYSVRLSQRPRALGWRPRSFKGHISEAFTDNLFWCTANQREHIK